MIRFRNPGTQYTTQIQVFKELYKEYSDCASFSLDDMAHTIARTRLMTAYGYAGGAALALSQTENDSLNSTKMNAKMYAEVFRLLGWVSSVGSGSYPLCFTYIGYHVANADDEEVRSLYEQCVIGINNPQEIMDVLYTEEVRFFKAALLTFQDMDGIMYKHELCYGPMSVDDLDAQQYKRMITRLKSIRGSYARYQKAYKELCDSLSVKPTLPDNSTRLPIAFMKSCGWVESERSNTLFPPKSLECLRLTQHGNEMAESIKMLKDLRLKEFRSYDGKVRQALIRLGIYSMLERAGYDTTPVQSIIWKDTATCEEILNSKKLLFSPYQTIRVDEVDAAMGIVRESTSSRSTNVSLAGIQRTDSLNKRIRLSAGNNLVHDSDEEVQSFTEKVKSLRAQNLRIVDIVQIIFDGMIAATQTRFYPFVAMLFRVLGFEVQVSRPGDNGARWDAIIIDEINSIPIEIKSPTEEQHISLKAIRQALENKVILLSRNTHPTTPETTSLAVGYYLPNDRAEVTNLILDFKKAYGFSIGVIDLSTLLKIAVSVIVDGSSFDRQALIRLEGFARVSLR
ncbi:MAG TPA: hypothetical protein GXZ86_01380 [Clostridiales bacterium]|nr:hypothetical protein [Clostridiales bacterium]